LLADVIERVGQADRGGGLAFAGRRRRDRRYQDQLAVRPALQRLDVIHRYLGLVVAVGLEVLRRDAEAFARDVEDRPLARSLRDFDVGFRMGVLRGSGGGLGLGGRGGGRSHENLVPVLSLALAANSLAATFGPSACTRVTLKRPSAQTTV